MKFLSFILKACVVALPLFMLTTPALADIELQQKAHTENQQQSTHNAARESGFRLTEADYLQQKSALEAQRQQLQLETEQLTQQFSENESLLATREEQLRLDTGSLGELFGVVRQSAKELQSELSTSVTNIDRGEYSPVVDQIVDAKVLPSMPQLTGLWLSMSEQIQASGEIAKTNVRYINGEGIATEVAAYRLGAMGLIGEQGYLKWNAQANKANGFSVTDYLKQPKNVATTASLTVLENGATEFMVVDPSRGSMLEQLALQPTLMDRLKAGGSVGKVILILLVIGLAIALFRGINLAIANRKIQQQLKNPTQPSDNPLGRVLAVYNKEQKRSVESLELRLLEAVVDEQQGIEKGLSMLKLLAALAPMLGLLGTVTGMIETFQVITQFGNGDPKVMAGGISMALVTTVLGLVAAMPLLLAHNILSTQSTNIRNILEKQGIALVATQAEQETQASQMEKAA